MKKRKFYLVALMALGGMVALSSCSDDDDDATMVHDISTAEEVSVDRFSADAATLMVRTATNGLPAANAAVNFDQAPFITKGLGPAGQEVEYYNFDVQSLEPAPIYVLFRDGESSPVSGQLNIIDVIPGETDYNDFWRVNKVTVPSNYKANEVAGLAEIQSKGYTIEEMAAIVNCPVVPKGSTATKRLGGGASGLVMGWYQEKIVYYFTFEEKALEVTASDYVPLSPIYVTFNLNPDTGNPDSGPASGFVTEDGTDQTHNVIATIPANATYSPLWTVNVYDNMDFEDVADLTSAEAAASLAVGVATVNCPVVNIP